MQAAPGIPALQVMQCIDKDAEGRIKKHDLMCVWGGVARGSGCVVHVPPQLLCAEGAGWATMDSNILVLIQRYRSGAEASVGTVGAVPQEIMCFTLCCSL